MANRVDELIGKVRKDLTFKKCENLDEIIEFIDKFMEKF